MSNLGEIIKQERNKRNDSQEYLAINIGVSRQTILNWEKGRTFPDSESLLKIAKYYQLSFDELIGLEIENKSSKIWKTYVLLLSFLSIGAIVDVGNNTIIPLLLFGILIILLIQEVFKSNK